MHERGSPKPSYSPPWRSHVVRNPQTISPWPGHIFPNSPRERTGFLWPNPEMSFLAFPVWLVGVLTSCLFLPILLKLCKQDYPGSSRCCFWWCGQRGDAPPGGYLWRWVMGASSHRRFPSLISMQTAGLLLKAKELQLVRFLPACRLAGLL